MELQKHLRILATTCFKNKFSYNIYYTKFIWCLYTRFNSFCIKVLIKITRNYANGTLSYNQDDFNKKFFYDNLRKLKNANLITIRNINPITFSSIQLMISLV